MKNIIKTTKKRKYKKRNTKKINIKKSSPLVASESKPLKTKKSNIYKVVCSKCKNEKKTTKKQIERLIGQFGSLEDVHDRYHCMDCRRKYNLRKDGRLKPEKRKRKRKLKLEEIKLSHISIESPPETNRELHKRYVSYIGRSKIWCKPERVSDKKWTSSLKKIAILGVEKGILHPIKKG